MIEQAACLLLHATITFGLIQTPTVKYNLADETPADSLIGNIAQSWNHSFAKSLQFILITSTDFRYFNDFFRITIKGDLITVKHVDRDNRNEVCGPLHCCRQPVCSMNATAIAGYSSKEQFDETHTLLNSHTYSELHTEQFQIIVQLFIHDTNDNAPHFLPAVIGDHSQSGEAMATPNVFHLYLREGDATSEETLPLAHDLDSTPNGVIDYRLEYDSHFPHPLTPTLNISLDKNSMKFSTTPVDEQRIIPILYQLRPLDFESNVDKELHMILFAIDGGLPPLTGSLSIMIHLLDINDNAPLFSHSTKSVHLDIPENTTMNNEPIYRVKATDADSAENGRVTYAISPLAGVEVGEKFTIDSQTGDIRVRVPLDYEVYSERQFVLPLVAVDHGSPQHSTTTSLHIDIRDLNDNVPRLVVQENITIPEGEALTKPVLKFYVKDEDELSQGKVKCSPANWSNTSSDDSELQAGAQFLRLHRISDTMFFVFVKKPLDFEQTPRAALLLTCVDHGAESEDTTKADESPSVLIRITATVTDRNDNAPVFLKTRYHARIREHAPQGTFVTSVKASDADSGHFGLLTYYIEAVSFNPINPNHKPLTQHAFLIEPESGAITIDKPSLLDRELAKTIYISCGARDRGGLVALTEVIVELTDINDSAPELIGSSEVWLEENQRVDKIIGHLRFVDKDEGRNAKIHLVPVVSPANDANKFVRLTMDPHFTYAKHREQITYSGHGDRTTHGLVGQGEVRAVLVSQMPVDRESYATLFYEILAYDEGDPSQSSTSTIVIQIADQNDNAPVPIFPAADSVIGEQPLLHLNTPFNTLVTQIRATDSDQGANGTVLFSMQSDANGTGFFNLNRTTGELRTAWRFQYKDEPDFAITDDSLPSPGVYLIKVLLFDSGVFPNQREHQFFIKITPEYTKMTRSPPQILFDSEAEFGFKRWVVLIAILLMGFFVTTTICVAVACWKLHRNDQSDAHKHIVPQIPNPANLKSCHGSLIASNTVPLPEFNGISMTPNLFENLVPPAYLTLSNPHSKRASQTPTCTAMRDLIAYGPEQYMQSPRLLDKPQYGTLQNHQIMGHPNSTLEQKFHYGTTFPDQIIPHTGNGIMTSIPYRTPGETNLLGTYGINSKEANDRVFNSWGYNAGTVCFDEPIASPSMALETRSDGLSLQTSNSTGPITNFNL